MARVEATTSAGTGAARTAQFHLLAKPSGPACNLDCDYCFYLEKEALYERPAKRRMAPDVLDAYVRNVLASTPPEATPLFAWQGGEPTLQGLPFFREAVRLQKLYAAGRPVTNTLQTNGVLIDEDWARFLAEERFLVGLSLDGPAEVHDRYRRYRSGAPSHHLVMAALERLQRHGVDYNVLTCVDRHSTRQPQAIYDFLKAAGVEFIQFTPVVERVAGRDYAAQGFDLEGPGALPAQGKSPQVAPFAVLPEAWGDFLVGVFNRWRKADIGRVFVMNIEWALASYMGQPGAVCLHQKQCGHALASEYNGDVYSCDHYVYPDYRLGNLAKDSIADMVLSPRQQAFGEAKWRDLPGKCHSCAQLTLCWGGCPKHRFTRTRDGEAGLNYLCRGYERYFRHITPWLNVIAQRVMAGQSLDPVMAMSPAQVRAQA
ncbi:anaerobic sulfatase maturase [Novosphingobium decolorationis]|uniref:Anaerobic sulfatase maturase n=1 Tax=Novosphingobium decolorationis TaxID=2698673 RepID=A0ABX8E4B9_9SPHN|nr:anaerobic sulfatase maturase [Novosphingobium decolorationis]MED5544551.1 anaerobic sulfatase maturase [Pseudomonadota bacterium]QVM83958.1 anaerobic sulfatase maturase [Novosphingobium decolorationis]